ncbi:MAG TPA: serine hydrolase [Candidatus Saccharimonadales bacterium]|nr:serine hydrolase [Candidatus Saccharimonadales bacterium]
MKLFRRALLWALVLVIVVGGPLYVYKAVHAAVPPLQPRAATSLASQTSQVMLTWPSYGEAAIGVLGYKGVLASNNGDQSLSTASIAKVVTALCVLQKHPLQTGQDGPTLTLTQSDVDLYNMYLQENGSLVGVADGEQLSERQALEAMLLPSGNNMADTLANWAFGSMSAYLSFANQYVATLGMTHTHLADASGFKDATVSTANDLVLLGETAMQTPALAKIVSETSAAVPVAGQISSTNLLLGQDGIVGIKTGNNDKDTGALLFASRQHLSNSQSITIVGVIMGGPSLPAVMYDTPALIDSVVGGFKSQTIVNAGDIVGRYNVPWQKGSVAAVATKDLSVFTWEGQSISATVHLDTLTAPASANQVVGSVTLPSASGTSVSVKLQSSIPTPSLKWKLLHP